MQPLTRQRLAASAYRTLGLSASAGQAAIDAAARRMRIWPDPARIPPTPWDLPWLGPLSRAKGDIEQAVARLADPVSRVEERLLWYHGDRPTAGGPNAPAPAPPTSDDPAHQHDAAVGALHDAWACEASTAGGGATRWPQVMDAMLLLAESDTQARFLSAAESAGEFDKRSEPSEVIAALAARPSAFASALVPLAQAAIDRGDLGGCTSIATVLRSAGQTDAVQRLLDGVEDKLDAQCKEMDFGLRDKLQIVHTDPEPWRPANRGHSFTWADYYHKTIRPTHESLCALAEALEDDDRRVRAGTRCAEVLKLLALGWEWSGLYIRSDQALQEALKLAEGTAFEAPIRAEIERIAPLVENERAPFATVASPAAPGFSGVGAVQGMPQSGGSRSPSLPPPLPPPLPAQRPAAQPPPTSYYGPGGPRKKLGSGATRVSIVALVVILGALARLVPSMSGSGSGGSSGIVAPTSPTLSKLDVPRIITRMPTPEDFEPSALSVPSSRQDDPLLRLVPGLSAPAALATQAEPVVPSDAWRAAAATRPSDPFPVSEVNREP